MKTGLDDFVATGAGIADVERLPRLEFTPTLAPEALHGLFGEIVNTIDSYTEADPVATLGHLLVAIGNVIGPDAHARVQEDRHPGRLNLALVGQTSKRRKGTSWGPARAMLEMIDPDYVRGRVRSGLSSGEGVIYNVRDAREEQQPIKERGKVIDYQRVIVDEGELDKRLLVIEPEFASVLKRMNNDTNTLSAVIREAWDHGNLSTLTKNSPLRATGAHISIVAHVTSEELLAHLTETDKANGFANRFLFLLVRRSKTLPDGAAVPRSLLAPLVHELGQAVAFARDAGELRRDEEAREAWHAVYPKLSEGEPGLVGAIISRAEAYVLRLSVLYALVDRSPLVRVEHLSAALAVWDYAAASARRIFSDRLGLLLADTILEALRARGPLTDTAINGLFKGNRKAAELKAALEQLHVLGKVHRRTQATDGRSATVWAVAEP